MFLSFTEFPAKINWYARIQHQLEQVESLSVAAYMNYTRLFHQWFKTRPWSGLKQLPHWWRSVIHTCRNTKISPNRSSCNCIPAHQRISAGSIAKPQKHSLSCHKSVECSTFQTSSLLVHSPHLQIRHKLSLPAY